MTKRQQKREAIKQTIAERYKKEAETQTYKTYSSNFDAAKKKGYLFKEGAADKYTKEEFTAAAKMFAAMAPGLADTYASEDIILEEQFRTSNDSISQAVMLWYTWDELVAEEPQMDTSMFRSNESYFFRRLRSMYGDDASYDLAMSY